ncbi:MAG: efflux RND transporter periplasmic adaptor subunit [Granulosicoccaceae bacterium]|jgi:HlyD family secretion protein
MRNPLRKHPVIVIAAIVLAALLAWGFWPRPLLVEVVGVMRAPMTVTIEEEGRTRVIDRYVIAAPVDGMACRIQLDVGDDIQQDQVLMYISPLESQVLDPRSRAEAQARVAAAESALRAAREEARATDAAADLAIKELSRLRPLADQGLISRDAFDQAQTAAQTASAARRSANFRIEVAQYELEAARSVLQYSAATQTGEPPERVAVRAPISGKILKVPHECEGPVRTGEPLLEVGDTSRLEVEVDVLSADAVKIKPGMPVLFERWGGEEALEGVVRGIEPVGFTKISALGVEEQRVLVIVDFTSPSELWQRLGDGYRVEASFVLWQHDNVLQVPASSLFRANGGWAVFAVDGKHARLRDVQVGQRTGLIAQILSGLSEGERVIDHPAEDVEDGSVVKLR